MRLLIAILFAATAAAADAPRLYSAAGASTVSYKAVHKFHEFAGTSHKVEGKVKLLPDGGAQTMVRVPVGSFDSGNGNRDEHMQETVDAPRFPSVLIKGVVAGVRVPEAFPSTVEVPLTGTVSFHGVDQPLQAKVKVTFTDADHATAETSFPISLEAFQIERPSLLFVKVEDKVMIEAKLVLEAGKK